jgi:TRAP-type C4-dicarboxylate transport system permease small subunit
MAIRVTWELYSSNYFTPTILMVPKFIFIAVIAFGFLNLFMQFLKMGFNNYTESKDHHQPDSLR